MWGLGVACAILALGVGAWGVAEGESGPWRISGQRIHARLAHGENRFVEDTIGRAVTPDGRYVVYEAYRRNRAARRIAGRRVPVRMVFVRDMVRGRARCVSVSSRSVRTNADCHAGGISSDGRFIVFSSAADNLVPNDTNGTGDMFPGMNAGKDVFIHDRVTRETRRVSVAADGAEGISSSGYLPGAQCSISADGRIVAFASRHGNLAPGADEGGSKVFVADRSHGIAEMSLVSNAPTGEAADGYASAPSVSANGRFVAFVSDASNLDPADSNAVADVFLHDRQNGTLRRVSVASGGSEGNGESFNCAVSDEGIVAFDSESSNLVVGDTNGSRDVFVHDPATGVTRRVSVAEDGSEAAGYSWVPSMSRDGLKVAFSSTADGLAAGDANGFSDVYLADLGTSTLRLLSANASGEPGDDGSAVSDYSLSSCGTYCLLNSSAANLVRRDRNGHVGDAFLVRIP